MGGVSFAQSQPVSAEVISRVSGETVQFSSEGPFGELGMGQTLGAGDSIRTEAGGAYGLLFLGRTAMRLHTNTTSQNFRILR